MPTWFVVTQWKDKGNAALKAGDYEAAIELYTK